MKSNQSKMVEEQFQARLKLHEKELKDLEAERARKEQKVKDIDAQLAKMNTKLSSLKWHEETIQQYRELLSQISISVCDMEFCREAVPEWMKLAKQMEMLVSAIKQSMCAGAELTPQQAKEIFEA